MTERTWERNLDGLDLDQSGDVIGELLDTDGGRLTALPT
jgi:hypothetical protein